MKYLFSTALGGLMLVAGSVQADTPETQTRNLERFTPYLQSSVPQFKFWSMQKWQLVGPDKVVVWTTINDAYLLTVEAPCTQLQLANDIGVTSQASHTVMRRMDAVVADHERCRIAEIQPIDYKRMQKDAEKAGAAADSDR